MLSAPGRASLHSSVGGLRKWEAKYSRVMVEYGMVEYDRVW